MVDKQYIDSQSKLISHSDVVLVSAWCWRSNVTGRITALTEATRHLHRFRYKYKYKYKYKRVIALIETRRHLLRFSFSLFLHLQQINILVQSSSSTNEHTPTSHSHSVFIHLELDLTQCEQDTCGPHLFQCQSGGQCVSNTQVKISIHHNCTVS